MNTQIKMKRDKKENNLKPKPVMIINPPPADGKCECCGRHISEIQPFGKSGDPVNGDFKGAYLVKTFRREAPYDEEAEKAVDEAEECCRDGERPREWMIAKYGKEKGETLNVLGHGSSTVGASWECRDCIILDEDEYFDKIYSRLE